MNLITPISKSRVMLAVSVYLAFINLRSTHGQHTRMRTQAEDLSSGDRNVALGIP